MAASRPIPSDLQDIVVVTVYSNLANLIAPQPTLVLPPGTGSAFTAALFNFYGSLGVPNDIQQVAQTLILSDLVTIVATPGSAPGLPTTSPPAAVIST